TAAVTLNPLGRRRAEQDLFQLRDRETGDVGQRLPVERPLERFGDAVVDELSGNDLADPQRVQRSAGLLADLRIVAAADQQIAFLELIREHEGLSDIQGSSLDRQFEAKV